MLSLAADEGASKMLKVVKRWTERRTDGWTDGQTQTYGLIDRVIDR